MITEQELRAILEVMPFLLASGIFAVAAALAGVVFELQKRIKALEAMRDGRLGMIKDGWVTADPNDRIGGFRSPPT